TSPYVPARLPWQGTIDHFRFASSHKLALLVQGLVDAEGPIHQDRVMSGVAESFGIARVGNQIRAQLLSAINHAVRARMVARRGEFLWPCNMGAPPIRQG